MYVDENTTLRYQWRDYQPSGYRQGPVVEIAPDGTVRAGGRQLLSIPLERWVTFQVTSRIGKNTANAFELDVTLPGENAPRRFHELHYADPIHEIDWLGLVSSGQKATEFYVDDIHLRETNSQ